MSEADVRPFFGELPAPIGSQMLLWQPPNELIRRTPVEWREIKIADGLCPMVGCAGCLDEAFYCSSCGNVSLPRTTDEEPETDLLPVYPLALTLDEYSPAQVDEAAA